MNCQYPFRNLNAKLWTSNSKYPHVATWKEHSYKLWKTSDFKHIKAKKETSALLIPPLENIYNTLIHLFRSSNNTQFSSCIFETKILSTWYKNSKCTQNAYLLVISKWGFLMLKRVNKIKGDFILQYDEVHI